MHALRPINPAAQPVVGPYSPAIASGNWVFVSGQIPRNSSGQMVSATIEDATQQALANLHAVLGAAGCTPADVAKTTVYMQDLADFDGMNAVYAAFFAPHRPARSTVQVAKLPCAARVEIECIAVRP